MKVLNWEERGEVEKNALEYLENMNADNPCKNYLGLIINGNDVRVVLKDSEIIKFEKNILKIDFPKVEKIKLILRNDGLLGAVSGIYEGTCFQYWIKGNCYYIRLEGDFELEML